MHTEVIFPPFSLDIYFPCRGRQLHYIKEYSRRSFRDGNIIADAASYIWHVIDRMLQTDVVNLFLNKWVNFKKYLNMMAHQILKNKTCMMEEDIQKMWGRSITNDVSFVVCKVQGYWFLQTIYIFILYRKTDWRIRTSIRFIVYFCRLVWRTYYPSTLQTINYSFNQWNQQWKSSVKMLY